MPAVYFFSRERNATKTTTVRETIAPHEVGEEDSRQHNRRGS
jgi:hypothetical protein